MTCQKHSLSVSWSASAGPQEVCSAVGKRRKVIVWCRKTNPKNAEEAKAKWTEGRKYTLTLVQPNGAQLEIIAGYMEQVCPGGPPAIRQPCLPASLCLGPPLLPRRKQVRWSETT